MEITVISEEDNPMLHRTDVRFRVSHAEATPDRLAVRDSLAARLNKSAEEVVVRKLDTKFGMRETIGEAKVYQAADFAKDVEQEHMLARNKIGDVAEEVPAEPESAEDAEAAETEPPAEEAEPAAEGADGDEAPEEGEPPDAESTEEPATDDAADEDEAADDDADDVEE